MPEPTNRTPVATLLELAQADARNIYVTSEFVKITANLQDLWEGLFRLYGDLVKKAGAALADPNDPVFILRMAMLMDAWNELSVVYTLASANRFSKAWPHIRRMAENAAYTRYADTDVPDRTKPKISEQKGYPKIKFALAWLTHPEEEFRKLALYKNLFKEWDYTDRKATCLDRLWKPYDYASKQTHANLISVANTLRSDFTKSGERWTLSLTANFHEGEPGDGWDQAKRMYQMILYSSWVLDEFRNCLVLVDPEWEAARGAHEEFLREFQRWGREQLRARGEVPDGFE